MNGTRLLNEQRLLVIGGGGSMGQAIGQIAYLHGATVTIAGRDAGRLRTASSAIGHDVGIVVADAATDEGFAALLSLAHDRFDHVVVAVSADGRAGSVPETSLQDAAQAFNRYWASYRALHHGRKLVRDRGSILLISGSSGRRPAAGYGVWSALHGAIESLARAAALELAPIRVNVLSPGGIGIQPDRNLVHHAGRPEDIALAALLALANPAMTSAVIDVDGGERLGNWSG